MDKTIFISDAHSWTSAHKIIQKMKEHGGNWLVWVAEMDGCLMCPADSLRAERVFRAWPEVVAGVFNAECCVTGLARSISKCRFGGENPLKRRTNQPWKHKKAAA